MISFSKFSVLFKKRRRSHSKVSNAERIVKIFRREAELQLSVQNNVGTLKQIWEHIWEKGPIGNLFTNSIPEKLPF